LNQQLSTSVRAGCWIVVLHLEDDSKVWQREGILVADQ